MNTLVTLALNQNKKSKTRSVLIVITILLTTMLLTIIATFCYGGIASNRVNAKELYGSFHGTYHRVVEKQLEEMRLRSEFRDIGRMAFVGEVNLKNDCYLYWAEDKVYELTNIKSKVEEGRFPEKREEIAAERSFFEQLGYVNPQVGDHIIVNSRVDLNHTYEREEFVICGLLKESKIEAGKKTYVGYVANAYYEDMVPVKNQAYTVYFRLNDSVKITSEGAEDVITELAAKCGIATKDVSINKYYLFWSLDPRSDVIAVGVLISLCVVLFSVAVIYNIFQVGVIQKIHEYGKIKALGATKKQLKRLVFLEGMFLAILGVPLGLLLGCVIGKGLFSWLLGQSSALQTNIQMKSVSIYSIPLLAIVVLISFLTVYVALKKPMKLVSRISPVEAIRYQERTREGGGIRKGKRLIRVKDLAMAGIAVNKKRTIVTILTMGLSCVLFVTIANFVGNIDNEYDARKSVEYGRFVLQLDYSLSDTAYPENNLDQILKVNPLGNEFVKKMEQLEGVTSVRTRKVLVLKEGNNLGKEMGNEVGKKIGEEAGEEAGEAAGIETGVMSSVVVFNEEEFKRFQSYGKSKGVVNYNKASKESGILFGWAYFMDDYGYGVDQEVTVTLENGKHQVPFTSQIQGAFANCRQDWAITEDTYKTLGLLEESNGYVWVDCEKEDVPVVFEELQKLVLDLDHVELITYEEELKTSKFGTRMLTLGAYAFLGIVGFIGFLNMANTLIVSMITRKQEIGVLQAIGMTNRQVKQMLSLEGLLFTMGTILIAILVGLPAGYALFCYGKKNSFIGLNVYHIPLLEIACMIGVIAVLQMILSSVLSKNVRKESLVDRIRY